MQPAKVVLPLLLVAAVASAGCKEREAAASLPDRPLAAAAPLAPAGAAAPASQPLAAPAHREATPAAEASPVLSGTLEPHRRSTLMPKVGGWVVKVHVNEGDLVKRGAPLVTVDPAQYRLTLRQAEAGHEAAKVGLDAAKLEYDRHKALLADKAIPQGQFDMIDARYKGALVQLKASEVSLDMARKALRDTTINAPYAGVIVKKHVSEGDNAAAMPPTPLITMEENEILDLRVQVPSSDLDRVKVGDVVLIHFPAGPPDMKAKIARIVPSVNPGTRTFSVIVELDNSGGALRAGLFAEVRMGAAAAPAAAPAKAPARKDTTALAKKTGAAK